ncbi:unnamed protein product [Phytophthora fragariaefolia]|uniref:Unnamed protein product n=1 Tax=Phytophthora fragariaefolia TaxID=1490495 RepID=A0A9W6U2P5_9STRA|nr:unnamed protein product [Phytophthora fragariaefolia]
MDKDREIPDLILNHTPVIVYTTGHYHINLIRHWPILAPLHPPSPKREAPVPIGIFSGNTGTTPFENSRSHEHKPQIAGPPGMTTETKIILRAAPDALGAAGPAEHDADAPTLSETEEKPPSPASKKHSGDPQAKKAKIDST